MQAMRVREGAMRDVSERVNAKVAWLSVLSLAVSCLLALWQMAHMKAYFIKKKLI
jgi:cytochrome oxidase assembly protein ShyY1